VNITVFDKIATSADRNAIYISFRIDYMCLFYNVSMRNLSKYDIVS